jgi:hypothetical protein
LVITDAPSRDVVQARSICFWLAFSRPMSKIASMDIVVPFVIAILWTTMLFFLLRTWRHPKNNDPAFIKKKNKFEALYFSSFPLVITWGQIIFEPRVPDIILLLFGYGAPISAMVLLNEAVAHHKMIFLIPVFAWLVAWLICVMPLIS